MREVHHAHDPENEREAQGDQGIDRSADQSVDQYLFHANSPGATGGHMPPGLSAAVNHRRRVGCYSTLPTNSVLNSPPVNSFTTIGTPIWRGCVK